jgi:hypothetical protein
LTSIPNGAVQSKDFTNVSLPTPSKHGAHAAGHDAPGGGHEIHLAIKNGVIAAVVEDGPLLRGIADRADDGRAKMFRPLHQQETNAAGGSVDQDRGRRLWDERRD